MRTAERLAAVALLAFAVYVYTGARAMPYAARGAPGPGFAPLWVSVLLGGGGVLVLARAVTMTPAGPFVEDRRLLGRVLFFAAAMVGAGLLIPVLGMVLTLAVFMVGVVPVLGGRRWPNILAAAALVPAALYVIFVRWLQVPFPRGPLGF